MKKILVMLFAVTTSALQLFSQQADLKTYPSRTYAGDALLGYSYGEMSGGGCDRIYVVSVPYSAEFDISALVNLQYKEYLKVYVDNQLAGELTGTVNGWQNLTSSKITMGKGKHSIHFIGKMPGMPMVEEISITKYTGLTTPVKQPGWETFLTKMRQLEQAPKPTFKSVAEAGDLTNDPGPNTVLANPEGIYAHEVDAPFTYSHYSTVYLTAGSHTFTTSGSTISRFLSVFNQSDYTYSWSNANGGPGGESGLYLYVAFAGYYSVMLRPVVNGQTGTTNIILDGSTLVSNATIGGRTYAMSSLKGGDMNFFTCRLTGGDTRMIASRYFGSSARGYNDDYFGGGGDWNWGLASRIKKDFNGQDSVQYGYVCAYSPSSTGVADIYLGTGNSGLHDLEPLHFPLLKNDDAIKTAEWNGTYNCISWSGGITTSWSWPPNALSTYNCTSANYLLCFDNFYSNNPVRYPGAWNYTRSGATVNNSVVDLWKQPAGNYQHASVRKPGNNHPHGYDWESKPGGTWRTLHPRYALTQDNWYGQVNDYYRHNGTYASMPVSSNGYATDVDAVKAGVAVFDVAVLTKESSAKLARLVQNVDAVFVKQFNELYAAWDKTKAANASLSDPAMYCKNAEHEALAAHSQKNSFAAMVLVMDKFVNSRDHFMCELLLSLTKEKYIKLLDEVKAERLSRPNDEFGRHKIHGDHDNGVLYIEKILSQLQDKAVAPVVDADIVSVTISPNPLQDNFRVKVQVTKPAMVSVKALSAQSRLQVDLLKPGLLQPGMYQYNGMAHLLGAKTGDIITVQVTVDGVMKSYKAIVAQ